VDNAFSPASALSTKIPGLRPAHKINHDGGGNARRLKATPELANVTGTKFTVGG
jgi:hypothetical protein